MNLYFETETIDRCLGFLQEARTKTIEPKRVHMTMLSEKYEMPNIVTTVLISSGLCSRTQRNVWKWESKVLPNVEMAKKLLEECYKLKQEYKQKSKARTQQQSEEQGAENVADCENVTIKKEKSFEFSLLWGLIKIKK